MATRTGSLTRRLVFLGAILSYSATLAFAQIAGGLTETTNTGLGGNNYIVGTIFSPEGLPITTKMRLRLSSPTSGEILAMTDDRGRFVFSGVGSGVHTIVIDGEEGFEPVMREVEIIRKRSTVPETYTVAIRLRVKINNKPKATPSVISASNAGVPKAAMDLYQNASKLASEKDYKGAIQQLKLAVDEYPKFVNALNQIGVLHLRLNEPEQADEAFRAALKINPEAYEPLINRSIMLFRLSRFKDAEVVLREALKVKTDSPVAHYYLGRTLMKLGRDAEAENELLACLKLGSDEFKEAHRLLAAIYLDRGASKLVIEQLETYLKLVPNAPDATQLQKVIEQNKRPAPKPDPKPER